MHSVTPFLQCVAACAVGEATDYGRSRPSFREGERERERERENRPIAIGRRLDRFLLFLSCRANVFLLLYRPPEGSFLALSLFLPLS